MKSAVMAIACAAGAQAFVAPRSVLPVRFDVINLFDGIPLGMNTYVRLLCGVGSWVPDAVRGCFAR